MPTPLRWEVNGEPSRAAFEAVHDVIAKALTDGDDIRIRRLFVASGIKSDQQSDVEARVSLTNENGVFKNAYHEQTRMDFRDPALGEVRVTFPKALECAVAQSPDELVMEIRGERVLLELEDLERRGVGRSAYQLVKELRFSSSHLLTVMEDDANSQLITWIVAKLKPQFDSQALPLTPGTHTVMTMFDLGDFCCDGLPGGGEYSVCKRPNGFCFPAKRGSGDCPIGSSPVATGFQTESEAFEWIQSNCGPGGTC